MVNKMTAAVKPAWETKLETSKELKMIIDAHTHMLHASFVEELTKSGGQWAQEKAAEASILAKIMPDLANVPKRVEVLNRNRIDLQVVTPVPTLAFKQLPEDLDSYLAMIRLINDGMARLVEESGGRLVGIGTVPLTGPADARNQEFNRAINNLGLKGIAIPSNFEGKPLDAREYEPLLAQAAQMGVPIYIHPNAAIRNIDRSYEADYDLVRVLGWPFETMLILSRLVFSGIMDRYPDLKIISHHLGGGISFFLGRIEEIYIPEQQQRVFGRTLAKPLKDYFSLFYYDTAIGGSVPATRCTCDVFGTDHLLFATDYPFGTGNVEARLVNYPRVIQALGLPETDQDKVFAKNAQQVLKLA
jgi:predicted TIM-barrel fold metal-dependent hydrolase